MAFKNYFFFTGFLFFLTIGYPQTAPAPIIQWEENYGGSNRDFAVSIRETNNGGYVMAGYTWSNNGDVGQNSGMEDIWIVKLDANGNLLWEKTFGGGGRDYAYDIEETANGGYVVTGIIGVPAGNSWNRDVWVAKLDVWGNLIWEKNYGGSGPDWANSIEQTANGGFIIAGHTFSEDGDLADNNATDQGVWFLKLDANGNLLWDKTYVGNYEDYAYEIQQTANGDFMVAGSTRSDSGPFSQNNGLFDIWVFKISSNGNLIWAKTFGGSQLERIDFVLYNINNQFYTGATNDALQLTGNGGCIVVGYTASNDGDVSYNHGGTDVWVFELDNNGNLLWEKTYGGSMDDYGASIEPTPCGNYVISANTKSANGDVTQNHGDMDIWLFEIDPAGNLIWEKTYGGPEMDYVASHQKLSGCGYVVAGISYSSSGDVSQNNGMGDIWVAQVAVPLPPPATDSLRTFCWSEAPTIQDLQIQGGTFCTQPSFNWYDQQSGTTPLPVSTLLQDGETYYVTQVSNACESPADSTLVQITPDVPPMATSPQSFCLDETPKVLDIQVNGQNLQWYIGSNGNTAVPPTTVLENGKTYYVSQTTDNCESSLLPVEINVFPPPDAHPVPPVVLCDGDGNGSAEIVLSTLNDTVSGGQANVNVSYHPTQTEAENGSGALPDNYTVQDSPAFVYARAVNAQTGCDSIVKIELRISPVPEIADLKDIIGCDDGNGTAVFDLSQNKASILGDQNPQQHHISYHENPTDADTGNNPVPNPENYTSGPATLFVRLENTQTGCFDTGSFMLKIAPRPSIANLSLAKEFCSDEQGGNFVTIDLTVFDDSINPGNPAGTQVVYYASPSEQAAENDIKDPENYTTVSNPQTVIAVVVDTQTMCSSKGEVKISIRVNDRPVVDISQYDGSVVCWDSDLSTPVEGGNYAPLVLETKLGGAQYTFAWTLDGVELPETGPSLEVSEPGVYEVTVTDSDGVSTTCSSVSSAMIIGANPPEFSLSRTPETVDNLHGVLVENVSGKGTFQFRLDQGFWYTLGENGTLPFDGVAPGTHQVYGRSMEGCGTTVHSITLIGYPKFFTPNADGHNDRWKVIGLENRPGTEIFIFDRYGKLLESLNPAAPGWDGTYNGRRMPSNDYWFRLEYQNPEGQVEVFLNHFSLIR